MHYLVVSTMMRSSLLVALASQGNMCGTGPPAKSAPEMNVVAAPSDTPPSSASQPALEAQPFTCHFGSPRTPLGEDQRQLVRNIDMRAKQAPPRFQDNLSATVLVIGRSAVSCDEVTERCRLALDDIGSYEHHAALDGLCGDDKTVCPGDRHLAEPIARARKGWPNQRCSGVIVAPGVVATAAHCLRFGLRMREPEAEKDGRDDDGPDEIGVFREETGKGKGKGKKTRHVAARYRDVLFLAGVTDLSESFDIRQVAFATKIIYLERWRAGGDIGDVALVNVDAMLRNSYPFPHLKRLPEIGEKPAQDDQVYSVGHPLGLPLTVSGCAKAEVSNKISFRFGADIMQSGSGSPVFSERSGELVGLVQDDGSPSWHIEKTCCAVPTNRNQSPVASSLTFAAAVLERLADGTATEEMNDVERR